MLTVDFGVCVVISLCVYTTPLSRTLGCPPFLYAVPRDGSRARSPTSSSRDPGLSYQTRLFPPGSKIDSVESKNKVIATLSEFYTLQQNLVRWRHENIFSHSFKSFWWA